MNKELPTPVPMDCIMGRLKPCKNCGADVWQQQEDEYGSLGDGGSHERFTCGHCRNVIYVEMPD